MTNLEERLLDMAWCLWALRAGWGIRYQSDIAKRLGVSPKHINRILRRHEAPSLELLNRWAGLYNMKIHLTVGA